MSWKFSNDKSIYMQIVDIIKSDIINGKYVAGQRLPTVREMAVIARVNPNTMQRAFAEIEQQGLIFTKRGDGRYVSEDVKMLEQEVKNSLNTTVSLFVKTVREMGFNDSQILEMVKQEIEGRDINV